MMNLARRQVTRVNNEKYALQLFYCTGYQIVWKPEMSAAVHEVQYCKEMQLSWAVVQTIQKMDVGYSFSAVPDCILCCLRGGPEKIADLASFNRSPMNA